MTDEDGPTTDDDDIPTASMRPLAFGCAAVAAIVIGIPVACSAMTNLEDQGADRHPVSERIAEANDFVWPLTFAEGRIMCPGDGRLVFVHDRIRYGLNTEDEERGGYADLEPIWRDDPAHEGRKLDLDGLLAYGNEVCGY